MNSRLGLMSKVGVVPSGGVREKGGDGGRGSGMGVAGGVEEEDIYLEVAREICGDPVCCQRPVVHSHKTN